ncbi:LYR motif-containing protein 2 isoform X2 [Numida meleagris]|uniref:LYR motif-containing protein 2 isoform X2 n=1 Tax=Numida meleagris TaxID=8996 RepID=UPI000B3E08A3|nr:LYR motif-containing protein 2 isoform X2 [Numida meleagris]
MPPSAQGRLRGGTRRRSKWRPLCPARRAGRGGAVRHGRQPLAAQRPHPAAEADRRHLQEWAREEFRRNKDATEEDAIRMMITQGHMQLRELQRALKLAKS